MTDDPQKIKIFVFRIGKKYGPEYETYLEDKLKSKYDLIWIRNSLDSRIALQWNKMFLMNLDYDHPIVVMDIDILLENNYFDLFDYKIEPGEFLSIPAWWNNRGGYKVNGGFYKYYPKDCRYIYEEFMSNPKKWQMHYIKNGTTIGPVNGEQYFVEDHVNKKLKLKFIPKEWVTRWTNDKGLNKKIVEKYNTQTTGGVLFDSVNDKFNDNVKIIHFTTSLNKPSESNLYKY
jgi:hypothetical protein